MFSGRLGGPMTVLHPESVTTTPLSTIWNNAFFSAVPFSSFSFSFSPFFLLLFLLFPFPFFPFFLFTFPLFPFFLSLLFVHNLQSRLFEITFPHFSRIWSIFFSCPGQLNRWPCHWFTDWLLNSATEQSRAEQSRAEQWFRFRFRLVDTSRHWLQWLQRQRFRFRLVDTSRH